MLRSTSLLALWVFTTCILSCRQESAIEKDLQPAARLARFQALHMAAVNVLQSEILKQSTSFYHAGVVAHWIDSLHFDDHYRLKLLDFGQGLACSDYIQRKGKILIYYTDSGAGYPDSLGVLIRAADSFAIGTDNGWYYLEGIVGLGRTLPEWYQTSAVLDIAESAVVPARYTGNFKMQYSFAQVSTPQWNDAQLWNGKALYSISAPVAESLGLDFSQCVRPAACSVFFSTGEAKTALADVAQIVLEYNPYGNAACDKVAKARLNRDEMIFNFW
ncbi:MAG: hypothetical protein JNL57_09290 [Bacteroidetes bacterium]|nr:hypothetical protein [Bacteroidota bacterium]